MSNTQRRTCGAQNFVKIILGLCQSCFLVIDVFSSDNISCLSALFVFFTCEDRKDGFASHDVLLLQYRGTSYLWFKSKKCWNFDFKGGGQNNESRGRTNNAFLSKNTIKVSYVPKDREETMIESSNVHNVPLAYASETSENHLGSPAIQKLFKKWIMILLSQSPHQVMDEVMGVGPPPRDTSETQIGTQSNGKSEILKMPFLGYGCNH
ncbi:hypothetical protein J1N35_002625 [Gossypium stocksii]|uniref:Uncharacterized protein n=1 Tax=Gossypium stocksii TaxID=47602 RepID=A0A9D3WJU5_9ROSI|nr:hypothetical protein J1N35_002625 [Gossypium stocksii]